jgi:hypothetical protein
MYIRDRNALSELKKEKKELEAKLKRINKALLALEPLPIQYMQWRVKALECIYAQDRYCQTTDILACVIGTEISDKELRRRYINALSVALSYLCKDGELKKFKLKKRKGDFYGFPDWFSEEGLPVEDRLSFLLNIKGRNIKDLLRA